MLSNSYFIGVDSGTTSTKALLFDEKGRVCAEGRSEHEIIRPHPAWVEQKAEWWWDAFREAINNMLVECPVNKDNIMGIALTHQRKTAVPVDREIKPIRNAILWNDLRCAEQNKFAHEKIGREKIYKRTGYIPGLWTVYKAMWLKDHEPDVYSKMYKFLLVQDYLIYKLTGNLVTTSSAAVMTGCLDIEDKHRWATDIIEALGVSSSIWVERILQGGEIVGTVSPEASAETGLNKNLPVITAAGDQPCGVVGAGVVKPKMLGINGGTSCTVEMYSKSLPLNDNMNYFIEISPQGDYYPENSVSSGGAALMRWLRQNVPSIDHAKDSWHDFYKLALEVPAGNWGMMLVPYLSGVHAPYWDVAARGVLFGLTMDHTHAHFVRAVIEGLAFEIRRHKRLMEEGTGKTVNEVRMYGGSANSDVWNQIFSDILGVQVATTETVETTALGAAICAAKGVQIYSSIDEAVDNMVKIKKRYVPNESNRDIYNELYERIYSQFYDRIHDLMHDATEIVKKYS
jgi:xylulokinase